MKKHFTHLLKKSLAMLPPSATKWIYLKLLRPKPTRAIADKLIELAIPPSIKIEEGILILNKKDVAISGALAMGIYENFEIELFRKEIKPGMTMLDIGANLGYYTVIAGKRVGDEGKVFSYEPEGKNFAFLNKNIELNYLESVVAINSALSNECGVGKFYLADNHTAIHSLIDNLAFKQTMPVMVETLDKSLEKYGSPIVDLIKMDIEGAEILVFEGMGKTLERSPRMIMFIEFYPQAIERLGRKPAEFLDRLTNFGFSLSVIDEDKRELIPLTDFGNFVRL